MSQPNHSLKTTETGSYLKQRPTDHNKLQKCLKETADAVTKQQITMKTMANNHNTHNSTSNSNLKDAPTTSIKTMMMMMMMTGSDFRSSAANNKRSNNSKALVKGIENSNQPSLLLAANSIRKLTILLATLLVVGLSLSSMWIMPNSNQFSVAEAKMHHSKRQVLANGNESPSLSSTSSSSSSLTGRENTNWWNIWWQRKFITNNDDDARSDSDSDYLSNSPHSLASSASEESPINEQVNLMRINKPLQLQTTTTKLKSSVPQTEYINEAVQPTVRPIVAVSFNGRTINLSDSQINNGATSTGGELLTNSQSNNIPYTTSDGENSVFNNNQQQSTSGQVDFDSNERLPASASVATDNVFVDKQVLLAQRKTMQHQMHWQSVKPTIIQPPTSATMRDLRTNRQVNELPNEPVAVNEASLGIQMRASMNTRQQQPPVQQQIIIGNKSNVRSNKPPGSLASPAQNLFQQQQRQMIQPQRTQTTMLEDNSKFEQQQNQMVDYSEENEPELDNVNQTGSDNDDTSGGRTSTDSSSSSMMREDKPNEILPGMRKTSGPQQTQQMQGRQEVINRQQTPQGFGGAKTVGMMGMSPQSMTTGTGVQQQSSTRPATSQRPTTAGTTTTTTVSPTTSGTSQSRDNGDEISVQTSTRSPVPPPTTTMTTTTTVTNPSTTMATTTKLQNEEMMITMRPMTTISSGSGSLAPKSQTMTTPEGRVKLENGRPATSFRQQGTTNAARPPTLTTQATIRMTDQTTTQAATTAPPTATTTTTSSVSTAQTTSGPGNSSGGSTSGDTTTTTVAVTAVNQQETTTMRPTTTTGTPATSNRETTTTVQQGSSPTTTMASTSGGSLETTTLRSMSAGNETSEVEGESEDGDSDEEESDDDKKETGSGTNLMNSGADDEDEDEEEETTSAEKGQEPSTTTTAPTPTGSSLPTSTSSPMMMMNRVQQSSSLPFTTQQPSITTIEIERLPKGSTTTTTTTPTSIISSSSSSSSGESELRSTVPSTNAPTTTTSSPMITVQPMDDISRIQMNTMTGNQQQDNDANIVMMTIGQNRPMDEEMAITMPMDALMKMMNQVVQDNERLQDGSSPMTNLMMSNESPVTSTGIMAQTTTTTTTPLPTTTSPTPTTSQASSTTLNEQVTTERPAPVPSTIPPAMVSISEEENAMVDTPDAAQTPATRKKLPPPPTPRAGTKQQQQQSIQMQTSFIDQGPQSMGSTTSNQMDSGSMTSGQMDSTSSMGAQKPVMVNLEPVSVSPQSDDMMSNGGREQKIELLNLDLMPIQRIMNNQMMPTSNQPASRNFERERLAQQQQQEQMSSSTNGTNSMRIPQQPSNVVGTNDQSNQQMEQIVIAEVEPGMRLRPPPMVGGSSFMQQQQQQQQQRQQQSQGQRVSTPIIMSDMMSNKNQANTVYMIMMNNQEQVAHSKRPQQPATMTTISGQGQTMSRLPITNDDQTMTTLMMQRADDQSRTTTNTIPTTKTSSMMMRTTQPSSTMTTSGGSSSSSGSASTKSPTMTTSSFSTSTTQQQQQQKQLMMIRMSSMNQAPQTTTTQASTTTGRPSFMTADNAAEMEIQRQVSNDQKPVEATTNGMSMIMRQQAASSTQMTFQPTGGATSPQDQMTTTTTTSSPLTTSDRITTTIKPTTKSSLTITTQPQETTSSLTTQKEQVITGQEDERRTTIGSTTTTTTTTTTTVRPRSQDNQQFGVSINNNQRGDNNMAKLERLQVQPMQGGERRQGSTKTGKVNGKTSSNFTSSFIPNKLRNDFNKIPNKQQQVAQASNRQSQVVVETSQTTTTQSPLTGMAIRQFGGANRMSVLGNQPVPFGRPAAMTMTPPQSAAASGGSRTGSGSGSKGYSELPTFEYGPSIAVRRPDEPLANGQIPNCTLTGKNFCVLTKDYPMNEVRQAVERSFRSVRIMYEELQTVSDQELHKDDFGNTTNNQAASGKFACQTQVEMMRPGWAKDEITKEWMLVVNTDVFPQRVRTESCAQPNTPCEFIAPFYDSTCQQRYSLHRMIAIDPHDPSRSPQVAVFRFPAGCVCRVHPIRKTTPVTAISTTTPSPTTIISSSTSKSIRRRR